MTSPPLPTSVSPPSACSLPYSTNGQEAGSLPASSNKEDNHQGEQDDAPHTVWKETKNRWKLTGGIFGSGNSGQAMVYRAERISSPYETVALKSFQKKFLKAGPSRCYREFIAMDLLKDVPHVPQLIETNIPKNHDEACDQTRGCRIFWIIMTVAPGFCLSTLTPPYSLLESISFSISLLSIVRSIHEKGIVHRDLKPDNIHIDCHDTSKSLTNARITVLDFGLAYIERHHRGELYANDDIDFENIEKERRQDPHATDVGVQLGNRWYRVPQLRSHGSAQLSDVAKEKLLRARRSPTIDASSVCAILFWLLTDVIPEEDKATVRKREKKVSSTTAGSSLLYHQQEESKIIDIVKNTMRATKKDICDWDIDRLSKYLLHTFDRGFADVDGQWLEDQWSVDQLLNHLHYMQFLLLSSPSPMPIQSRLPITFNDDFTIPMNLFIKAKHDFLKNAPRCDWQGDSENYYWTDGWNERRHIDLLTHSKNGVTWTIPVTCSAKLVKIQDEEVMRLFVSSTVNNVDVQLPIYSYEMTKTLDENKEMIFNRLFRQELYALISIFHGKTIYLIEDRETSTVSLQTDLSC